MTRLRVMSVFGTRPEAIKMCPLVLELCARDEIESIVCVTAQHREMLDSVLGCFGVVPDYDLDIMKKSQTLADITAKILSGLGAVIREAKPDLLLVHGDTTTTFSSALAAFYEKLPVGHVEAGLRTWDRHSPYPEEINRCMVGRLAEYHFAPTAQNAENLRREGINSGIFITGNTVIDALKYTVGKGEGFSSPELGSVDFEKRRVITMTCHRRENYGQPMRNIFSAVLEITRMFPDVEVVYPIHLSPEVRKTAGEILQGAPNIRLIEPLDAIDMHRLMSRSYLVLTDSGGIQEEAPALGKPVIVTRRETERPEAVAAGTVVVSGVEKQSIIDVASGILRDDDRYGRMARAVNPYGDGRASRRIVDSILYSFGLSSSKPEDFCS